MTAERARAYTRLMRTIHDPAQPLTDAERRRVMLAADAFVFARSWGELEVRSRLADMRGLADDLAEQWPAEALEEMLDDLDRCGPARRPAHAGAAREVLAAAA